MRKNAGIKSKKEAAQRLMNGELFYHRDDCIFFDEDCNSPFRYRSNGIEVPLTDHFEIINEWQVEIDWRENIGKGVWCWVWSNNESLKAPALVTCYAEGRGFYSMCYWFSNAESMTEAEVMEYVLK